RISARTFRTRRATPRTRSSRTSTIGPRMARRSTTGSTNGWSVERGKARAVSAADIGVPIPARRRVKPWTPTRGYWLLLVPPLLLLLLFFVWPLAELVLRSVAEPSWGLGNFEEILQSDILFKVLVNTFLLSASVTLIALLLSYPTAWVVTHVRGRL